jgi:hypothetical protein
VSAETAAALAARVERAVAARARLARRPLRATVASLAAAARRWREDAALARGLPEAAGLGPEMVAAVLPLAAAVLDEGAMAELVGRELGAGALDRPAPAGPAVVAHVLASNVPALALPAIALGCLAGAAVAVKSGRRDPLSAPAFERALADVDPELAATVVTDYWPGGDAPRDATLARADVVVVTGGDDAVAAFAARVRGRLVAHGPRLSVAAVGDRADAEGVAHAPSGPASPRRSRPSPGACRPCPRASPSAPPSGSSATRPRGRPSARCGPAPGGRSCSTRRPACARPAASGPCACIRWRGSRTCPRSSPRAGSSASRSRAPGRARSWGRSAIGAWRASARRATCSARGSRGRAGSGRRSARSSGAPPGP